MSMCATGKVETLCGAGGHTHTQTHTHTFADGSADNATFHHPVSLAVGLLLLFISIVYVYLCMYTSVYILLLYIYLCIHVCVYIFMYIYLCIYVYVCIVVYT